MIETSLKKSLHGAPLSIDIKIKKGPSKEELARHQQQKKFEEDYINPPEWISSMRSLDIVSLPFCGVPFEHDFYEKAFVELSKRGFGYTKIFLSYFLLIGPLFWLSFFPYVKKIGAGTIIARWPLLFVIPFILCNGIYHILISVEYDLFFLPIAIILTTGYFLTYIAIIYENLLTWRRAAKIMNKYIFENITPRDFKKDSKKTKKK